VLQRSPLCCTGLFFEKHAISSKGSPPPPPFSQRRFTGWIVAAALPVTYPCRRYGTTLYRKDVTLHNSSSEHCVTMDSTRHALNDALDDPSKVERLSINQASDAAPDRNSTRRHFAGCAKCHSIPAPGLKRRHCGRCQATSYCGQQCAKADRARHKRHCERLRGGHDEALAPT
jgi:hypothetical protein